MEQKPRSHDNKRFYVIQKCGAAPCNSVLGFVDMGEAYVWITDLQLCCKADCVLLLLISYSSMSIHGDKLQTPNAQVYLFLPVPAGEAAAGGGGVRGQTVLCRRLISEQN